MQQAEAIHLCMDYSSNRLRMGQSAAQKMLALECSHQGLQAEKQRIVNLAHEQEQALLRRIVDFESRELERAERANAIHQASAVPPMPFPNQPPAAAQSAFQPTDEPKPIPTNTPEVDRKTKSENDRRDKCLPTGSPRRRSRPPASSRTRSNVPPK